MNRTLVRKIARVAGASGITFLFDHFQRLAFPTRAIVYYHKVVKDLAKAPKNGCERLFGEIIELGDFVQQIDYLKRKYRVVPLPVLLESMFQENNSKEHLAAITFDDAYREVYEVAFPELKRSALPATVFCPGDVLCEGEDFLPLWIDRLYYVIDHSKKETLRLGDGGGTFRSGDKLGKKKSISYLVSSLRKKEKESREALIKSLADCLGVDLSNEKFRHMYLSKEQIWEMGKHGIDFEAHTMSHPDLSSIGDIELETEIRQSKMIIERITGKSAQVFAYPFGERQVADERCREMLARNGFMGAVTTIDGLNWKGSDPFILKRIQAPGASDSLFTFRISGLSGAIKRLFSRA